MIDKVAIVGCGQKKSSKRQAAKDLYTSTYFKLKRQYAEQHSKWFILSAKHGMVHPEEELEPYDTSIDDLTEERLDEWAFDVWNYIHNIACEPEQDKMRPVVFLVGTSYLEPLFERSGDYAIAHEAPLQQCSGIGEQMKWLKMRVAGCDESQKSLDEVVLQ